MSKNKGLIKIQQIENLNTPKTKELTMSEIKGQEWQMLPPPLVNISTKRHK